MPVALVYGCMVMLILGAAPLPYGYYTLLRIIACGTFAYGSYIAFRRQFRVLPYFLGFLAVLFNPIMPVHLSKALWIPIDIAAAVVLLVSKHLTARKKHDGEATEE